MELDDIDNVSRMDRSDWLRQMRREIEEKYDTVWSPGYGETWGLYSNTGTGEWLRQAGLDVMEEGEGDEYHHFLVRKVEDELLSNREVIIASYADGPKQLEAALAGLSEGELDVAESDGAWTIRQMVHHLVDGDDLWKMFVKQAIGHPGSQFELQWYWDLPQTEWAARWAYATREVEPSLALFRAGRGHMAQLLAQVPEAWERTLLVHWPSGKEQQVTVAWMVEMQARHVAEHVDDIGRARQAHGI